VETYLILIIILFILAASDLTVGIANDAVNFLNSAIGSKVAPRHVILSVAALGVFVGTLFSSGMMEVARKGIFNPDMFMFNDVMCIFLAVMFTDIILLDFYNTFGLPTSTTVSLISSLLGGSVAGAIIKIQQSGMFIESLGNYINTGKTIGIFTAIIVSVIVSFVAGAVVQYISRLIFTFNYEKKLKRYGAVWGAFALTSILYFILIKGAKGASFLTESDIKWINENTTMLLGICWLTFAFILEIIILSTRINILKPIVLTGTFALALAFAANDLVNFIGVPLAGLSAYQIAASSNNPFQITMQALKEPVSVDNLFLIAAGIIMVITLWVNKKARTVTQTEIDLGRQFEGFEKFNSNRSAKEIVRTSISFGNSVKKLIPDWFLIFIESRFQPKVDESKKARKEKPSFDLLRASVNLMVASILISLGTAYKLPLSTTYVTFMVAMATSFADKSWGRESAVYRVSGVLSVIGGWFLTAFIAFSISGIFALGMYFGGVPVIIIFCLTALGLIIRTNILHSKKEKKISSIKIALENAENTDIKELIDNDFKDYFENMKKCSNLIFEGLISENRKKLKKALELAEDIEKTGRTLITKIVKVTSFLPEDLLSNEIDYGKIISTIEEINRSVFSLSNKVFEHFDNNHSGLSKSAKEYYSAFTDTLNFVFDLSISFIKKKDISKLIAINEKNAELKTLVRRIDRNIIQAIQKGESKLRVSLLLLNIVYKSEHLSKETLIILDFVKLFAIKK
jgi:phosphate/sulfate permease